MNDIYAYFDYHGTLKERVSAPIRANSTQVNSIYAYWDNQSVEPVTYSVTWRLVGSDSFETTSEHYAETLAIPANYLGRRDLVFFKEAKSYNFIRFPVPSAVTAVAGTYIATIRYALSTQATFVLGSLTFEVEGDRGIVLGESLTLDQYNYLLEQYSEVYDWAALRFLPLTGGTLTGDLTIDGHDLTAERVFAKELWQQTNDALIMHYDGDSHEIRFGTTSGDFNPTFFGSLGVYMWDGRTKEYPTIRFDYYDGNDEYESTTEEQIATQQWSNATYLKLAGGTITGNVDFGSTIEVSGNAQFDSGVTIDDDLSVYGDSTFTHNVVITAAAPTAASHATRKDYVDNLIASVKANAFQVIQTLPQAGEEGIIYLVPVQGEDYYTQYIWEGNSWIDIGDTNVHLSGYLPLSGGSITGDLSIGGNLTITNSKLTNGTHTWTFPSKFGTVATVDDVDTLEGKITNGLITAQKARRDGNGNVIIDTYVRKVDIVDDLTSTDSDKPLSANQGRILNDSISELKDLLYEISVSEATYAATSDVFAIPQTIDSNRVLVSPGCVLSKLKGNTTSFNQLVKNGDFSDGDNYWLKDSNAGTITVSNGIATWTRTGGTGAFLIIYQSRANFEPNDSHQYLLALRVKASVNGMRIRCVLSSNPYVDFTLSNSWQTYFAVLNAPTGYLGFSYVAPNGPEVGDSIDFDFIEIADLTLTGEESLTLDQLKAKYNKYYPYNAGTLYPSIVSKIESYGANLFDGEWESGTIVLTNGENYTSNTAKRTPGYIAVYGGQTYTFENDDNGNHYLCEYDANHAFIKSTKYESSTYVNSIQLDYSTAYVRLVVQNATTKTNFHLGTATIGYKPYVGKLGTINLPSAPITLRGVNASQDEISFVEDGAGTYTAKIVRYRAVADLGDLPWNYNNESGHERFLASLSGIAIYSASEVADILCSRYPTVKDDDLYGHLSNKVIGSHNGVIQIYDTAYTNATDLKNSLNGIYLDYELATPTEETLATGLTFEQVSLLFEEGGYMQVENANSDYTHADTELAFAVKRAD